MYLHLPATGGVTLEDAGNFRAFKIVVGSPSATLETVRSTLAGVDSVADRETAWVSERALRQWTGYSEDRAWQEALSAMIAKARPHGWIDDTANTIRAHMEWPAPR
jgi:hypothetical protein